MFVIGFLHCYFSFGFSVFHGLIGYSVLCVFDVFAVFFIFLCVCNVYQCFYGFLGYGKRHGFFKTFHDVHFLMNLDNFVEIRHQLDLVITFDRDVARRRDWSRSKAESQGFPSVTVSTAGVISIKSYHQIELVSNFNKSM